MSRVYEFRGLKEDGSGWVCGNLVELELTYIYPKVLRTGFEKQFQNEYTDAMMHRYEVKPETVGQYTGLKDKNGVEIYEGDIIQTNDEVLVGYKTVPTHYEVNAMGGGTEVVYSTSRIPVYEKQNVNCVVKTAPDGHYYLAGANKHVNALNNAVIGNIHQHPELLEVK